jgi:hypothetical protein
VSYQADPQVTRALFRQATATCRMLRPFFGHGPG